MKSKYVAGFLFSNDESRVALIQKEKPEWQKGRFNAIGGKIEADEDPLLAMSREFEEETGVYIAPERWTEYCRLTDSRDYVVSFFHATSNGFDLEQIRQVEIEKPEIVDVDNLPSNLICNLHWLIPMALQMKNERANSFTVVEN